MARGREEELDEERERERDRQTEGRERGERCGDKTSLIRAFAAVLEPRLISPITPYSAATHDPPTPRHLLRRCSYPPEPRTSSALPPSPPILLGATMERLTRSSPRQPFRLPSPSPRPPRAPPSPIPPVPPCPFPHRRMRERASLPFLYHALSSLFSAYIYHFGGRSVSHPWQCIPHLLPFPSATPSPVPSPPLAPAATSRSSLSSSPLLSSFH